MRDLWMVILELWHFSTDWVGAGQKEIVAPEQVPAMVPVTPTPAAISATAEPVTGHDLSVSTGTIAYVAVQETACYIRAVHSFDGVIARLSYGTAVLVGRRTGRFVEVAAGTVIGWVLLDDLSTDEQRIFPQCIPGETYDAYHATTNAIRLLLQDAFTARDLVLPLTAEEYASYRLRVQKITIAWPAVRPRLAGGWHTQLRGVRGVHIGIEPKTGSLIEWTTDAGEGHLALVEAVSPEEVIQLVGVGLEMEGKCTCWTVASDVWHEWRPVFISVS